MIVDLDIRKWGDRPHYRMDADLVGRDEHGIWLAVAAGTAFTGPNGPGTSEHGFVTLVPHDDLSWVATFWHDHPETEVYVDITTAQNWETPSHLVVIDLDLDVVRHRDGRVELLDEDEFEEHRVAYSYPPDVTERATSAARSILATVRAGAEPFGYAAERWFSALRA